MRPLMTYGPCSLESSDHSRLYQNMFPECSRVQRVFEANRGNKDKEKLQKKSTTVQYGHQVLVLVPLLVRVPAPLPLPCLHISATRTSTDSSMVLYSYGTRAATARSAGTGTVRVRVPCGYPPAV